MYNQKLFDNLLNVALLKRIAKLYEVMQKDARKSVRQLFDDNDVRNQLLKAMASNEFKELVFSGNEVEYGLYDKLNNHTNTPDNVSDEMFDQVLEEEVNDMKQEFLDEIDATFNSLAGEDEEQQKFDFEEDND